MTVEGSYRRGRTDRSNIRQTLSTATVSPHITGRLVICGLTGYFSYVANIG